MTLLAYFGVVGVVLLICLALLRQSPKDEYYDPDDYSGGK
jgi:hypothetical protein